MQDFAHGGPMPGRGRSRGSAVKPETLATAQRILGHQFQDPTLLQEALTHASIANTRLASNERMEFLGDAVLELVICDAIYRRFPQYQEGELTKVKSAVVSRRTCADIALETGLTDLLITGKGVGNGQSLPVSLSAAVYESVVAAIYLDGGFDAARRYILESMGGRIDAIAACADQQNYKAILQQHVQRTLAAAPVYELLDEKGPDHSKCFEVCVVIDGRRFPSAWGTNKKAAEQRAAMLALEELGLMDAREVDSAMQDLVQDTGE
jgi:ribonuclease-3